ncbi:mobile mystery protein A [Thermodesulfobacteriota bacterium]
MQKKNCKLIRDQLDTTLKRFQVLQKTAVPRNGWIRAIRDALGMNGRQFSEKLGVTPARITKLESDEVAGSVSIKTMKKTAEALDCVLVYALVPKTTLEETIRKQALKKAEERFKRSSHTMALEAQELRENEKKKFMEDMVDEMMWKMPKTLWEK